MISTTFANALLKAVRDLDSHKNSTAFCIRIEEICNAENMKYAPRVQRELIEEILNGTFEFKKEERQKFLSHYK